MDDTLHCPICGTKLKNHSVGETYLFPLDKMSKYTERVCQGINHTLYFFVDDATGRIDYLKIIFEPSYSKLLEIDYVHQRCRVGCTKNSLTEYIDVGMIQPDFPNLTRLKEKINLYVVFS
jgi:hypothetical protein